MRRRYEITNRTKWRTDDLRRFVIEAARQEFTDDEKPVLRVTFVYCRGIGASGCASIGGSWSKIRVTSPGAVARMRAAITVEEERSWQWLRAKRSIASVLCHEFAHKRWEEHYTWADALELREAVEAKSARAKGVELAEERRALVAEALKRWESKSKRAANAIRKLRARLRYYDRRMAAMRSTT